MTKKQKQAKKATKSSKRTKGAAQPEDETDTATQSVLAEAPKATPVAPKSEVAELSQQAIPADAPVAPSRPTTPSAPNTRSDAAKANIKEGLRLHQIAGRPTKAQLVLVFGKAGYLLTLVQKSRSGHQRSRSRIARVGSFERRASFCRVTAEASGISRHCKDYKAGQLSPRY